jgi:hypothetical protein
MQNITKTFTGISSASAMVFGLVVMGSVVTPSAAEAQRIGTSVRYNGTACPTGFVRGTYSHRSYNDPTKCYDDRTDAEASTVNVTKPGRLDRCPLAYFTSDANPMQCATRAPNPPTVRLKGSGACRTGEVVDWGIWCVSNYGNLTRGQAATGLRDWNAIYTLNRATSPTQDDLPEGSEYTPAYITIFGRVKPDGSPMGGGAPAPQAAAAPAPTRSAPAARDTRVGSLSPQRRTATTWGICPSHWYPGQAGSDLPNPDLCYPSDRATPIFPVASQEAPCPEGYSNSVSWCMAASRNMPTSQAAAQTGAQNGQQAQPNCPAPASGAAQQAGAALGGLLGGRRGNSQAGAALGGLLGAAAGAAKPAGCP